MSARPQPARQSPLDVAYGNRPLRIEREGGRVEWLTPRQLNLSEAHIAAMEAAERAADLARAERAFAAAQQAAEASRVVFAGGSGRQAWKWQALADAQRDDGEQAALL